MQAIAVLGLLSHDIKNRVDELRSLRVVALGPVVSGAGLPEDEVIRTEDLPVRPRSDAVHRPRLQIHQNRSRNEPAAARLVVVDVDSLELQIGVALVAPGGVDAVLGAYHLPELGADLVATLATLNVQNLTHLRIPTVETDGERDLTEIERSR